MRIAVTEDNIKEGRIKDGTMCPIALAMRDRALARPWVETTLIGYAIEHPKDRITQIVGTPPKAVGDFIERFDGGEAVSPFEFEFTPTKFYDRYRCPRLC